MSWWGRESDIDFSRTRTIDFHRSDCRKADPRLVAYREERPGEKGRAGGMTARSGASGTSGIPGGTDPPVRSSPPYAVAMDLDLEERRRRARRAAWMVGLGLLVVNILIGYPSCSGKESSEDGATPASVDGGAGDGSVTKSGVDSDEESGDAGSS